MKSFICYTLPALFAAMVGYTIHHSIWLSIINFIFWPISLIYWLITHQLTLTVIKSTFGFVAS